MLRLEGKSLLSYLQSIISNDATKLAAPGAAPLYACVLTPQVRPAPRRRAGARAPAGRPAPRPGSRPQPSQRPCLCVRGCRP